MCCVPGFARQARENNETPGAPVVFARWSRSSLVSPRVALTWAGFSATLARKQTESPRYYDVELDWRL
jgi:hypothetical protein